MGEVMTPVEAGRAVKAAIKALTPEAATSALFGLAMEIVLREDCGDPSNVIDYLEGSA